MSDCTANPATCPHPAHFNTQLDLLRADWRKEQEKMEARSDKAELGLHSRIKRVEESIEKLATMMQTNFRSLESLVGEHRQTQDDKRDTLKDSIKTEMAALRLEMAAIKTRQTVMWGALGLVATGLVSAVIKMVMP